MKAIILAAGRGSRMRKMTDDRPKCLVELRGKPLLDWQLEALSAAGIEEIAIVTGYKQELLAERGLVEFHNDRWAETNMVSSLACAEDWLEDHACIVSYSDIFYNVTAVQALIASQSMLAITYDPNWLDLWTTRFGDPLLDAETFSLTSEGTLAEIGNRPLSIHEVHGQFMGLLRIAPKGWAEFVRILENLSQKKKDEIHITGTLQMVVEANRLPVSAIPYYGVWGEIDSESDLENTTKIFQKES